jgi:hypothetical protein
MATEMAQGWLQVRAVHQVLGLVRLLGLGWETAQGWGLVRLLGLDWETAQGWGLVRALGLAVD